MCSPIYGSVNSAQRGTAQVGPSQRLQTPSWPNSSIFSEPAASTSYTSSRFQMKTPCQLPGRSLAVGEIRNSFLETRMRSSCLLGHEDVTSHCIQIAKGREPPAHRVLVCRRRIVGATCSSERRRPSKPTCCPTTCFHFPEQVVLAAVLGRP